MSRTVALSTARARIRELADIGPDTTTGRYPNARLNREFNASWARAREISQMGSDGVVYLKQTAATTMTPGAINSSSSFGSVPWPADCVAVHGIDVVFSANDITSLEPAAWEDRNTFRDVYGGPTGRPIAFCVNNIGVESTNTVTPGTIAIMPAPNSGYTYTIWYLPSWVDKVNDTDVFDGINGHEDWAIWDTVIKMIAGDNNMQATLQLAMSERDKAELMLKRRVQSVQRVGPLQRRDVAGYSRRARAILWRRP